MRSAALAGRTKRKRIGMEHKIAPYGFIFPYFAIFLLFSIFPLVYSVYISLTNSKGFLEASFVGFANYKMLLTDERFRMALGNTFLFMLMIIPIQIMSGFAMAVMLSSKALPTKKAFRTIIFLPYLTASIALGAIFGIMFDSNFGTINRILMGIGIQNPPDWISSEWPARVMVALITIWRYAGYTAVLFLAGITNINTDIYEACEIDGANAWQRTFKITLPMLRHVNIFIILTTMIGCFQIFEEPFMIFQVMGKMIGGPNNAALTGTWLFYDTAFGSTMQFGYGSAIGVGLTIIIAIITLFFNKLLNLKGEN